MGPLRHTLLKTDEFVQPTTDNYQHQAVHLQYIFFDPLD